MHEIAGQYIPSINPAPPIPLSRFLPTLPQNIVKKWLSNNLPIGRDTQSPILILDPFSSSPFIPVEIARAGYSVLAISNNPIIRLLIEIIANPLKEKDLNAAFAELVSERIVDELIEPHLRALYATTCNQCGSGIMLDAVIWERGNNFENTQPISKIIKCPYCKFSGELPLTEQDYQQASQSPIYQLNKIKATELVASLDDPIRKYVEEIINLYTPRALHTIISLLNIRDRLNLTSIKKTCLEVILLTLFEMTNNLWSYPTSRTRPKQLSHSPYYIENNSWLILEKAVATWSELSKDFNGEEISISYWPDINNKQAGICLFPGRVKDLFDQKCHLPFQAIISCFPRPNHAFWSLSAIWSGWLWGKEAFDSMKAVLKRKRYDWGWHTLALVSSMQKLSTNIKDNIPFFGLIGEIDPGYISSSFAATDLSGFELINVAMRGDGECLQVNWQMNKSKLNQNNNNQMNIANIIPYLQQAIKDSIWKRGEPINYQQSHIYTLCFLVEKKSKNIEVYPNSYLRELSNELPGIENLPSRINSLLETSLILQPGFIRLGSSSKSFEVGQWWIHENDILKSINSIPLSDQIEKLVYSILLKVEKVSLESLDQDLCTNFLGLDTPSSSLIQLCLESYGKPMQTDEGYWTIRDEDKPQNRLAESRQLANLITQIGHTLNYSISNENPVVWKNHNGDACFVWYLISSAAISNIIFNNNYPAEKSCIILPGGRANLAAYKINHNFLLQNEIDKGWHLVKNRHIKLMAENPILSPDYFDDLLDQDKFIYNTPMIKLF